MPRQIFRPAFSPDYDFYVLKPFTLDGIEMRSGQKITKSQREALGVRKLEILFNCRKITPQPSSGRYGKSKDEVAAPMPSAGGAGELKATHKGFGKYDVTDQAGTVIGSGLSKVAAHAMVAAAGSKTAA
jgi:hypothetical protein